MIFDHRVRHLHAAFKFLRKEFLKNKIVFSLVGVLLLAVVVELSLLGGSSIKSGDFTVLAHTTVTKCSSSKYKPTCYDDEIPKLMGQISMEDAFQVTRLIQDEDPSYRYCHVLGHKLAARETAVDPDKWQDVIKRCPSGLCSNGCIHGAFQERFRKEVLTDEEIEVLKPQFENVCENRSGFNPTGLEKASCYHALGHLFMYVTGADIRKSVSLCKEMTVKPENDYSQLCFDGSFMQIFQPLEPDDFALIVGKEVDKKHVKAFCDDYAGKQKGSCWSESWPLFREELYKPENLINHCNYLSEKQERGRCFNALLYVYTAQMGFNQDKVFDYCSAMPSKYSGNCFAQASSRLIETDYRNGPSAVALCEKGAMYDVDNLCFKELLKYSTFNFHQGSEAFKSFCAVMPVPWNEKCFSGNRQQSELKRTAE
ncbi:MAG: hypothetical protein RLZZ67_263 [Candidatus Parcubacteria bacterium]|jgi:hypothetical protein